MTIPFLPHKPLKYYILLFYYLIYIDVSIFLFFNSNLENRNIHNSRILLATLTNGSSYTIPEDCLISIGIEYTNEKSSINDLITINSVIVYSLSSPISYFNINLPPIFCKKGDVINAYQISADTVAIHKIS